MKKIIAALLMAVLVQTSYQGQIMAQDPNTPTQVTTNDSNTIVEEPAPVQEPAAAPATTTPQEVKMSAHQLAKKYFIDGSWEWMSPILIIFIIGLAIIIERIITLSLATINAKKFMVEIEEYVKKGDFEGAQAVCKATPGPIAEVLGQGLRRANDGVEAVEKAIVANASVQSGLLEKGLIWIALLIAVVPMVGFMGTVVGMIIAFDTIEASNDIRPAEVAGGMKVALLTTVFSLMVAMVLQSFYNYLVSKLDGIINDMEDSTVTLIDALIDNGYAEGKK